MIKNDEELQATLERIRQFQLQVAKHSYETSQEDLQHQNKILLP